MSVLANNLLVLIVYSGAGLLVGAVASKRLAPLAPWAIFAVHLAQIGLKSARYACQDGVLPFLALTLPHGIFEIPGLFLACIAGSRLCRNREARGCLVAAAVLILAGAWVETRLTPFPLAHWL